MSVCLDHCGVPWNSRVLKSENRGSERKFRYNIKDGSGETQKQT
jgi:hypothetical protein